MANINAGFIDIADFHAHILPGADHGSYSVSESLKQLDFAIEHGVRKIVATPHFYPTAHTTESFLERRKIACEMLFAELADNSPQIAVGAEVLLCPGIDKMPDLDKLFICGTNTLLLELPYSGISGDHVNTVARLVRSGVKLVLAHVDRYPVDAINNMISVGALVQINADSLCSIFKRRRLMNYFKQGAVAAIGSDIHNNDKEAYKCFSKAVSVISEYSSSVKEKTDELLEGAFLKK